MSKLLTEYHVAIGADTAKFVKQMGVARHEVSSVVKTLRESEPAANKLAREIANLDKVFAENGLQSEQYALALEHLKKKYGETSVEVNRFDAFMRKNEETLSRGKKSVDAMTAAWQKHAALVKQAGNDAFAAGMRQMNLTRAWQAAGTAAGQSSPWQSKQAIAAAKSLDDAWAKATNSIGKYNAVLRETFEGTKKVSAATMAAVNRQRGSDFMTAMGMAGGQLGSFATMGRVGGFLAGAELAKQSVVATANAERAQATFGVLLGDMERANSLIEQMRQISRTSPIRLDDLQKSAQTMLAFGVSGEKLIPTLKQIGDITGGDSLRFQMLSLAFAQSAAAGRLMGQDLLQMINAGFNPLQVISQETGRSLVDLRKDMENGAISSEMVAEAFRKATSEGGKFNGMLQAQVDTISGQWRGVVGQFDAAMLKIGEVTAPVAKTAMQSLQGVLIGTNWALEKFGSAAQFAFYGLKDIATLDGSFTSTNEFLDSLNKTDTAEANVSGVADQSERWRDAVAAIAGYYQKIEGIEGELSILLDRRASQDAERTKQYKDTYQELLKLQMGEGAYEDMVRKNLGWTDQEIWGLRRMQNEINRLRELEKERTSEKKEAQRIVDSAMQERDKLQDAQQKAMQSDRTDATNPSLIKAGSSEAYRFLVSKQGEQLKKLDEQKRIQAMQLEVSRRIQAGIERLNPMVAVG